MFVVYHADNTIDAYLVCNLLKSYAIEAQVLGEYLQGGMGELPLNDLIRVVVFQDDVETAAHIIKKWQSETVSANEPVNLQSVFDKL